jgi:hypothetical protein
VRYLVSTMVALAVLATAFVSVRLHHDVAALRYVVYELDAERGRAERELRLSQAEYETAKSPRRLLERWSEASAAAALAAAAAAEAPALPALAPVSPAADEPTQAPSPVEGDDPAPEGDR